MIDRAPLRGEPERQRYRGWLVSYRKGRWFGHPEDVPPGGKACDTPTEARALIDELIAEDERFAARYGDLLRELAAFAVLIFGTAVLFLLEWRMT